MTSPRSTPPADIASCHALLEQQWTELEEAATRIETLEATITEQAAKLAEQQQTIEQLAADNASLQRTIFGSRRERFVDDEPQTPPRDACVPAPEGLPTPPASPVATGPQRTSRGRRRRILPQFLPREVRRYYLKPEEIPEEMRDNPRARRFFKKIGDKLEVIPMQLKIIEEYQEVIMLDQPDETLAYVAARRPASLVKSFAQPSVLAYLTVCRFADHIPYYRLENILGRSGCWIDRSTQWRWMRELAIGVTRLVDLMWTRARQSSVLGMDETYVKELCGRGKARTGYLWVGVGDARHPYDCFFYTSSRQCAGPEAILAGFCGYLVADAYVAYERIGILWEEVLKVSCWVHARRGFEACHALGPTTETRQALAYFQQLFDIEDRYRASDAATRQAARQRLSRPIVEEFHAWLVAEQKRRLPKDKLRGAIQYMLDRWPSFTRFLESGDIPLDNNAAERALKFPILGRKAWLFVGHHTAGETAAKLFTLTKTCNRLSIDPFAYLQDVYARLPTINDDELESLLPDRWLAEHPQHLIPQRVQEAHDRALRTRERRAERRRQLAS